MWGARRPEAIPTALPWLTQESGIDLTRVFAGDDLLAFRGAEPVYLEGRRGIALHYRDADGHLVTYIVLPAPALPLPDRQRVQVERADGQMPRLASDLEDQAVGEIHARMSPVVLERGSDDVGVLDRHVLVVEKHLDGCDDRSRGKAVDGAQDPGRLRQHEVAD